MILLPASLAPLRFVKKSRHLFLFKPDQPFPHTFTFLVWGQIVSYLGNSQAWRPEGQTECQHRC